MASSFAAALGAVTCLVVGCTGILYGSDEAFDDHEMASHGAAVDGGSSTSPRVEPAPSSGREPATRGSAGERSGAGGFDGFGGMAAASGQPSDGGDRGFVAAGGAGEAEEPPVSVAEGGASEGGRQGEGGRESSADAGEPARGGTGGQPSAAPLLPGDEARGYKLVVINNCHRCHGSDLAGRTFYRNITPDLETGVGTWTDEQLALAIVAGVNPKGELLCAAMPVYSGFTAQGLVDVIAFLRSIPPKYNEISLVCPGHDP